MNLSQQKEISFHSVSSASFQGCRSLNEDRVYVNPKKKLFSVFDGFGGSVAGVGAANLGVEAVKEFLEKEAGDLDATLPFILKSYFSLAGNILFNALIHANRKMNEANKGKKLNEKGGASAIVALIDGEILAIANVGTCNVTLYRDGKKENLVKPRSYGKLLNPEQDQVNEMHQIPMIALGMATDLQPEILEIKLKKDDFIVFHSDGLSTAALNELLECASYPNLISQKLKEPSFFSSEHENQSLIALKI